MRLEGLTARLNGMSLMKSLRHSFEESSTSLGRGFRFAVLGVVALLTVGCGAAADQQEAGQHDSGGTAESGPPSVEFSPEGGATEVSPVGDIGVEAHNAKLTRVNMTNSAGEKVAGSIDEDGSGWTLGEPLGYGKTYEVSVTAKGSDGRTVTEQSEFTTVNPESLTYVSMNPLDGETVGVGQPLAFYFSEDAPAPDKQRAEQAINISTDPHVEGAFYWFNDREVHWRPENYWKSGTEITINANVYGKDLGNGVYGEEDRTATVRIGKRVVLSADGESHRMKVEVDGEVKRTIPVSLGKPSFPSHNGTHVVMRKHESYVMDSSTFGLGMDEGGYRTETKWAVRISNGGEFLHAAPWSVADQGERNVSHGCINMSLSEAEWVYDLVKKGDVVNITNSGGKQLPSWDGFGDWQIPWSEWVEGNK
ncbi:Lipoprotein-anchoring transpeptidase ErfK/SrfK [Actinopolyspora saharensis]|uniref:Lipoprotein-anchoring transpeptidase ErfK/SrfK n=2 Tax=Actinopolyspora saharensis TaxID=995062 RepID=A0A1H1D7T7_9ACTN|nr:Lipoprotein-anchoring transpeptidase ErfK/SrfK [Actinopolyspora saharensis]